MIAAACLFAWFFQFLGHQIWRYFTVVAQLGALRGNLLVFAGSVATAIPALVLIIRQKQKPGDFPSTLERADLAAFAGLILTSAVFWSGFALPTIGDSRHVFGDESFHGPRTAMMCDDVKAAWELVLGRHAEAFPFHPSHYMMYPSLAYTVNASVATLLGDGHNLEYQRAALLAPYLIATLAFYLLARVVTGDRRTSFLLGLIPASSPLLISYTMSFYIEIHYVGLVLFAATLLVCGLKQQRNDCLAAAAFVASIAPLIRESAFPSAFAIGATAALAVIIRPNFQAQWIRRLAHGGYLLTLAMLPFAVYYTAKSNYTNRDKELTSLLNVFLQDHASLALYSLLYLGPVVLALAGAAFLSWRKHALLILAALVALVGAHTIYAMFDPGYMPWSRNYLLYYAPLLMLVALGAESIRSHSIAAGRKLTWALTAAVALNIGISFLCLDDNRFFHESEAVFDEAKIARYLRDHRTRFEGRVLASARPAHMGAWQEWVPNFTSLSSLKEFDHPAYRGSFVPFHRVIRRLHPEAPFLLFYWFENHSRPKIFREIPRAPKPRPDELKGFIVLVEAPDRWSGGKSGVMLLARNLPPE